MADNENRLPPRARAKIFSLADQEQAVQTAMHANLRQINEIGRAYDLASDDARKMELKEEVERRKQVQETQHERYRALVDLNAKVRRFLDLLPADAVLEAVKPVRIKLKDETYQQAVTNLRGRIIKLISERGQVERAALPTDEIRAQMKKWITERALKGRPTITASHEKFDIVFSAMRENAFTPTVDVLALLAWYDPEYLENKLTTVIDEMPKPTFALTPAEKSERLKKIKVELEEAERYEVALIDDAMDHGVIIDHRPNVSIPALLALTVTKKNRKAA